MAKAKNEPKKTKKDVDSPESTPSPSPSNYTVVARRYRPQQLTDLIGQEHVAKALANSILQNRIAHAFLFTGARGVGKTSSARIFAKALNCEKGPTATPCDVCDICKHIIAGDDPDVIEIDGASNNKVDEVRELKNNINFRPTRARFKIYIIDEVHMLSTGAFNALLKTLEEPPSFVKFILATTEVQKIPITILSRCQRYDFRHIGPNQVFETLKHIVAKEGLKAEDDALRIVAKRSGGSMRDAQSLLDQLLAFSEGALTAEGIRGLLGTSADERIIELAEAILKSDSATALGFLTETTEQGLSVAELIDQLIEYWRCLMLIGVGGPAVATIVASPTWLERCTAQAKQVSIDTVLAGLDVLTTAKSRLVGTSHVSVIVEATIVRLCRLGDLLDVNQLAVTIASGQPIELAAPALTPIANPRPTAPTGTSDVKKNDPPVNGKAGEFRPEQISQYWPKVLKDVGLFTGGVLEKAGLPAILAPNSLALRFPANYRQQYDQASASSVQATLLQSLKTVCGGEWTVRVEYLGNVNGDSADDGSPTPAAATAGRQKTVLEHPLLKRIAERLGGQLVKMDPGFDPNASPAPVAVATPVNEPDGEDEAPPAADDTENEG